MCLLGMTTNDAHLVRRTVRSRTVLETPLCICIAHNVIHSVAGSEMHQNAKPIRNATGKHALKELRHSICDDRDEDLGFCDLDYLYTLTSVPSEDGRPEGFSEVDLRGIMKS